MLKKSAAFLMLAAGLMLFMGVAMPVFAQGVNSEAEGQKIKSQIVKIGVGQEVTIERLDGQQFAGPIEKINDESVVLHDVGVNASVEVRYRQIGNAYKGLAKTAIRNAKSPPSSKSRLIRTLIFAGVAIIPIIILTARRH